VLSQSCAWMSGEAHALVVVFFLFDKKNKAVINYHTCYKIVFFSKCYKIVRCKNMYASPLACTAKSSRGRIFL